jgi:hypothetical protein
MTDVELAALKAAFETATGYSEWATIAVTVGVFIELVALFIFSKEMPPKEKWVMVFATLLIVGGCAAEYIFGARATTASIQLQDASDKTVARLQAETRLAESNIATAQNNAAITEERLLNERRLTARERWRLERVERAVLPRSLYVNWPALVAELKVGNFHAINIALVGRTMEASEFAFDLMLALQQAGVLGRYIDLSAIPNDPRGGMHSSSGADVIIGYSDGDRLAQMLWQKFQIGGGSMSAAVLPPAWVSIPTDMNCLVIEENNWAMSPGSGQPGEGLDKYGGPDPAPH